MDEFIDGLLREERVNDIQLPRLWEFHKYALLVHWLRIHKILFVRYPDPSFHCQVSGSNNLKLLFCKDEKDLFNSGLPEPVIFDFSSSGSGSGS